MRKHTLALAFVALLTASMAFFGYLGAMVPLVIVSGFLDGIHPCGFAVLLFFISLLLSLRKSRRDILFTGSAYIAGVFAAYFLIGLGILRALTLFSPHFMAKAGAALLFAVGAINIFDGLTGRTTLRIPKAFAPVLEKAIGKTTALAAFIAGFLVGLCAFPCAGGIYVAILGLIAAKFTFMEGMAYLVLYNLMFVLPLIIALLFASNEKVVESLERIEAGNKRNFKLVMGAGMVLLSLFILFGGIL